MSGAVHEANGLFGPDSVAWRVDREVIVLAGGSCALLMQAAHPVVAAGVDEHSSYATDPFGRLRRTLTSSFDVVFGTRSRADAAIRRVNAIHAAVRGQLPDGAAYSAADPEALLWVHATLVDTALRIYSRFVGPLSADEERRYLLEAAEVAERLGRAARRPALGSARAARLDGRDGRVRTRSGHPRREAHRPNGALPERIRPSDSPGTPPTSSRSPRCPIRCGASTASAGRRAASAASNAWPPSPGEPCRSSRRRCDSCRRRGRRSAG